MEINITPDQEKILVAAAKKKFLEYHRDSTEKLFIAHQVTDQDLQNGYYPVPDEVYEVNHILSYRSAISMTAPIISALGIAYETQGSYNYTQNGYMLPIGPGDSRTSPIVDYFLAKKDAMIYDAHFNREDIFRWSRTKRQLRIIGNPGIKSGNFIVYDADVSLENEENFWQVEWFIDYTTNLFKRTWGENLTKFSNVELPGGITLNGEAFKTEANERIKELEDELLSTYSDYTMIYVS
jgi:hypothetical protein